MEVITLDSTKLQNDEHVHFGKDFLEVVDQHDAVKPKIEVPLTAYKKAFDNENTAYGKVSKSATTEEIEKADHQRGLTYRGFKLEIMAKCLHFNPNVKAAAKRILVVLDKFGDVSRKSYDKESEGISQIYKELRADHTDDLATLNIMDWLEELNTGNNTFLELVSSRYTEQEGKTQLTMDETRVETDDAFRKLAKRVNALVEIEGEATYSSFVNALNLRIEHYNNLVAQRHGRNVKKDEKATDPNVPPIAPDPNEIAD